jgi:hypothetical protein
MWSLVGFAICDKRILTIMHSRRLRLLFTHHNEANGSQKKQIRIKKQIRTIVMKIVKKLRKGRIKKNKWGYI